MERVITVKGSGSLSLKPDQTVVTMTLRTLEPDYDTSMSRSAELLNRLREAAVSVGFDAKDLKTTDFRIRTEYEGRTDDNGRYTSVFVGYACVHELRLEFDFDTGRLAAVLGAVSRCSAEPELNIAFAVKDKSGVSDALLESAAVNARHKAEVLATASGVALGRLLSIDYNWGEINVISSTRFEMEAKCMTIEGGEIDMEPENIHLNDSAAFVWEIKDLE